MFPDLQPTCHNGGIAEESDGTWTCKCASQFQGTYCEKGKFETLAIV